jgi:hypothetical protein
MQVTKALERHVVTKTVEATMSEFEVRFEEKMEKLVGRAVKHAVDKHIKPQAKAMKEAAILSSTKAAELADMVARMNAAAAVRTEPIPRPRERDDKRKKKKKSAMDPSVPVSAIKKPRGCEDKNSDRVAKRAAVAAMRAAEAARAAAAEDQFEKAAAFGIATADPDSDLAQSMLNLPEGDLLLARLKGKRYAQSQIRKRERSMSKAAVKRHTKLQAISTSASGSGEGTEDSSLEDSDDIGSGVGSGDDDL